jgi:hypothetical protein
VSGITPEFEAGKPISARSLERVRMDAERIGQHPQGLAGAAAQLGDITPLQSLRVYVVDRSVSQAAKLVEHEYTITDGVERWSVDHRRLIVDVEPTLIDGVGAPQGKAMAFWPASVAGVGVISWRAWGILYRGPGSAPNTSDYAVRLFGLCVARGC